MKLRYWILVFLIISSCKNSKNELYEFNPTTLTENRISLSEIADEVNYIALDDSVPLGRIYDNIEFINNSFYLSVKDIGILKFNNKGDFIRKIGNNGRGPGEYLYFFHFTVEEKSEYIYVLDGGRIIKVYSKDGNFLKSFSIKQYGDMPDVIKSYHSKLFVSYQTQDENVKYEWIIIDSTGNPINKKEKKRPIFTSNIEGPGGAYVYNNKISYWNRLFTDTVFSISQGLYEKPSFVISEGKHRLPKSKIYVSPFEIAPYLEIDIILETNRYFIIQYSFYHPISRSGGIVLIDKKDRKSFLTNLKYESVNFNTLNGIVNDIDGGPDFLPKRCFDKSGREYLIGLIYPYQIKARVASIEFKNYSPEYPEKKKELEKLANSLKETDNPILMIVRLKK